MTVIYFVRHAQPDYGDHDDVNRPLTEKGLADRQLVTIFLADKDISAVLSSPYRRSYDTVKHFADSRGLPVLTDNDFRERKVDSVWIEDIESFFVRQWGDFGYKLDGGESLGEVQRRNIAALNRALEQYSGQNIVIGTHGTALSTILNYYDSGFGYEQFCEIKGLMPWIVRMEFDGTKNISIQKYNVFE